MIATHAVSMTWPNSARLRFPDIALPTGQTLLLRGPSGSGKSTWLALVSGLLTPTEGELIVGDQPLSRLTQTQRDAWRSMTIGFLPQGGRLSPALNVQDNLALVAFASGRTPNPDHQATLVRRLGLQGLMRQRPHALSGGQALRVALARALLLQPALILADEPTASLDDDLAGEAMALLQEHTRESGRTLVVATHDQRAVQALCGAQTLWLEAQP
jgi:putative ABC transport system ATP-binding protein